MIARLLGLGFLSFLILYVVSQQVRDWAVGGMRMTELKPCPFCGGEAEVKEGWAYGNHVSRIQCKKCAISTQPVPFRSRGVATRAWNRRAEK